MRRFLKASNMTVTGLSQAASKRLERETGLGVPYLHRRDRLPSNGATLSYGFDHEGRGHHDRKISSGLPLAIIEVGNEQVGGDTPRESGMPSVSAAGDAAVT